MSRETATPTEERTGTVLEPRQAGTVGGPVDAIAFGAVMTMQTPGVLENAIPAMYGLEDGLAYGVIVWPLLAVVPIRLSTVGFPMAPNAPNVAVESLVGHVVYGLVLGLAYAVLTPTREDERDAATAAITAIGHSIAIPPPRTRTRSHELQCDQGRRPQQHDERGEQ